MNDYSKQRWEKLSAILGDEGVPLSERVETAFDMLEAEIRGAFQRGVRTARQHERPGFTSRTAGRSREGRTALQAGILHAVDREQGQ